MPIPYLNRDGEERVRTFDRTKGEEAARKYLKTIPVSLTLSPDGEEHLKHICETEESKDVA